MKSVIEAVLSFLAAYVIGGSTQLLFAHEVGIKLFDATPVRATGPVTSLAEAVPFRDPVTLDLLFEEGRVTCRDFIVP